MKPYQALIWNEWRQMRNNVMALAGVTVLPGLLMLLGCEDKTLAEYILVAVALIICMPILYSVVLGDSFAREFDQKTDCFLSELPITPTTIFFCKYCASLMIFLALSAVSSLIMALTISHAMNLNPGRGSINTLLLLFVLIPFWISAHATVFLTSLLSKQPGNGIAAIIIMPLLILLLLPGAMVITMFFINDNSLWIRYSVLLTPIILYGFCIGSGWYCSVTKGLYMPGQSVCTCVDKKIAQVILTCANCFKFPFKTTMWIGLCFLLPYVNRF